MSDKDRWLFGRMRQKAAYFFHVYGYRPDTVGEPYIRHLMY